MKKLSIFNFILLLLLTNLVKSMNLIQTEKDLEQSGSTSISSEAEISENKEDDDLEQLEKEIKEKFGENSELLEIVQIQREQRRQSGIRVKEMLTEARTEGKRAKQEKDRMLAELDSMIANKKAQYEAEQKRQEVELEAEIEAWKIEEGTYRIQNEQIEAINTSNFPDQNPVDTTAPKTEDSDIPELREHYAKITKSNFFNKKRILFLCTLATISGLLIYKYLNSKQKQHS